MAVLGVPVVCLNSYFHDYHVTGTPTLYNQPILVSEQAPCSSCGCRFRNYYETLFRIGVIVIEDSLFEDVTGDAIDFDTAAPGSVIRRCTPATDRSRTWTPLTGMMSTGCLSRTV
jgi:hypothetical protein